MKRKEVIICVLSIIILIISLTEVFATNVRPSANDDDEPTTLNEVSDNSSIPSIPTIDTGNNNLSNNIIKDGTNPVNLNVTPVPTVNNTNSNTNIPNTGIADTPIIAVGICIISAVIAYTQIRRYKY